MKKVPHNGKYFESSGKCQKTWLWKQNLSRLKTFRLFFWKHGEGGTVEKRGNFMHFIVAACLLQFRGYFLTKLYLNGLNRLLQIFSSKTASFKYSSLDCRLWHFLLTMSKLELFVAANERGKYFWKFVLGNVYVGDDCTMC